MNVVEGMSLRDWFAGQVLGAVWADSEAFNDKQRIAGTSGTAIESEHIARSCYKMADAMLAVREKAATGGAA